jgi:hypothetical protein
MFPWIAGNWQGYPDAQERRSDLLLPLQNASKGPGTWKIDTGAGLESAVVLCKATPLATSSAMKLPDILRGFPAKAQTESLNLLSEFECRRETLARRPAGRVNFDYEALHDPIQLIHKKLRDCLGPRFDVLKVLTMINAG